MDVQQQIGSRVREIRLSLDLTQQQLAERAHLAYQTISRIERGKQGLNVQNLYQIATALGVPFESLFAVGEPQDVVLKDAVLRELVQLLRTADQKTVLTAHRLVQVLVELEE